MPAEAYSVWEFVNDGGLLALSFLVIWGFLTGRIVPGWVYQELKVQRDEWRQTAQSATGIAETGVSELARRDKATR